MLKGIVVQMHLFVPLKSFIVQIKQKKTVRRLEIERKAKRMDKEENEF